MLCSSIMSVFLAITTLSFISKCLSSLSLFFFNPDFSCLFSSSDVARKKELRQSSRMTLQALVSARIDAIRNSDTLRNSVVQETDW